MDLSYLREFITFSAYMNVSEAARRLHMAQPTLSHHIAAVEKEVGVQLVNRTTTPLTLTIPGRVFVNKTFELLRQYDGIPKKVNEARQFPMDLNISLDKTHPLVSRTSFTWKDLEGMNAPIADGYFRLWVTTTRLVLEEHVPGVAITPNSLEVQSSVQALKADEFQLYDGSCNNIPMRMNTKKCSVAHGFAKLPCLCSERLYAIPLSWYNIPGGLPCPPSQPIRPPRSPCPTTAHMWPSI